MIRFASALLLTGATVLAGCSSGDSSAGLTTASVLGESTAVPSGEGLGIRNDDPRARPVQVAWTSARAQKCGFNFDPARLRQTYMAYESSQGAANLGEIEKAYDQTVASIRTKTGPAEDYCTDRKGREIKADLTRHLAGDYRPNLPQPKVAVAECGGLFATQCDSGEKKDFKAKDFWADQTNKKTGAKNEQ